MEILHNFPRVKLFAYLFIAFGCMFMVTKVFWNQEVKYASPTPIPGNFKTVSIGDYLPEEIVSNSSKAVLLHFFNPDCPCSRFNMPEFRELVEKFGEEVEFRIVLESDSWGAERFTKRYGNDIPVVADPDGQLADACGIYATPQAVLADEEGCIYYKGNYNRARFCTQPDTRFAFQAIRHLLAAEALPAFSEKATTAYGCSLPSDNRLTRELTD